MTRPVEKKIIKAPPPSYDRNAMYYVSDGLDFVYEPAEPFTKKDVMTPGHFNAYREELRVGTRITCRLGDIQDGIIEVELQVIECSLQQKTGDVMVSHKGMDGKFTPCRHDGTMGEEKEQAA